MKRCPECLFLYPESDERCDFDKTLLEVVDDAEIEAATNPKTAGRKSRKTLPIAIAAGLVLAMVVFAAYYGLSQMRKASASTETVNPIVVPSQPAVTLPSPTPPVSHRHHLYHRPRRHQKHPPRPRLRIHVRAPILYRPVDQESRRGREANLSSY